MYGFETCGGEYGPYRTMPVGLSPSPDTAWLCQLSNSGSGASGAVVATCNRFAALVEDDGEDSEWPTVSEASAVVNMKTSAKRGTQSATVSKGRRQRSNVATLDKDLVELVATQGVQQEAYEPKQGLLARPAIAPTAAALNVGGLDAKLAESGVPQKHENFVAKQNDPPRELTLLENHTSYSDRAVNHVRQGGWENARGCHGFRSRGLCDSLEDGQPRSHPGDRGITQETGVYNR